MEKFSPSVEQVSDRCISLLSLKTKVMFSYSLRSVYLFRVEHLHNYVDVMALTYLASFRFSLRGRKPPESKSRLNRSKPPPRT